VYFNDASKIVLEPPPSAEAADAEAKAVDGQLSLPGDEARRFQYVERTSSDGEADGGAGAGAGGVGDAGGSG